MENLPSYVDMLAERRLKVFYRWFSSMHVPVPEGLPGVYRATFVGPGWLRRTAAPSLSLLHFAGWWGKRFSSPQEGINLFWRDDSLQAHFPVSVNLQPSRVDGHCCAAVIYPPSTPFPWRYVIDELRAVDDDHLLGMTLVDRGVLRRFALPFILARQEVQL